jgi:hypothetical protein
MSYGTKQEPFPWGIMALSALAIYACTILMGRKLLGVTLGDTDDALRLVELREFLQSGSWYDLHMDRLSPPLGYTSHWSRLPDMLMAGIYLAIIPFSSTEFAELATRAIYPGLWIMPALIAVTLFTFKMVGHRLAVVSTLILIASSGATFPQYVAGRIDHHDAQITLSVLAIVSSAFINLNWRYAIITGLCSGLLLTIGLEGLPFLIVAAAVIAVRYMMFEGEYRAARSYALSIGLMTLAGLAISLPPSRWLETACDALAFNLTAAIVAGSTIFCVWTFSTALNKSFAARALGVGIAGLVAAITYVGLDPACLHGPFGHVNPAVKPVWLDLVVEMQPVFKWGDLSYSAENLVYVTVAFPALLSIFWLVQNKDLRTSLPFITIIAAFFVSLLVGLGNLRMTSYLVWFATPITCIAIFQLFERLGSHRKILAAAIVIATAPPVLEIGASKVGGYFAKPTNEIASSSDACSLNANFSGLAKLPQGTVLSEVDLGPYILALTKHSVVAAPYHRIGDSILSVIRFFNTDTVEQAYQVSRDKKISYVVICNKKSKTEKIGTAIHLSQALRAGSLPEWLEPASMEKGNPIEVYRVKDISPQLSELRSGIY